MEQFRILYGDEIIYYSRTYHSSGNSKLIIKVHDDGCVVAHAPLPTSDETVQASMNARARWIWKQLEKTNHLRMVTPRQYISGETQFYLGRRYMLKVISDPTQISQVKLKQGKLNVTLGQGSTELSERKRTSLVKSLLEQWYFHKAKRVFHERLNAMLPMATWEKGLPSFRLMAMKKQWGSCSPKGNLMLNPHLIKAPKECIDYVILHELCHIAEHNHGDKFWRLLGQVMPQWKEVKIKLDDMAELYLNE